MRNKDICCESGLLVWVIELLASWKDADEDSYALLLSIAQHLGRHRAPPEHAEAYLGLLKQSHEQKDSRRLCQQLEVLKVMTKQVEPSKVFDFDGSPEAGIFIPPFRLGQNGYSISFWLNCDAVSPELAGREQRLLTLLNDQGDGIIVSIVPQRRANHALLCVTLHSKNNITTQVFESTMIAWQKWWHISIVHTPSRLFQRRSELKIWVNGQMSGAKTLGYPDVSRPFSKACWGSDPSLATEMAPPCPSLRGQLTLIGLFGEPLPDDRLVQLYTTLPDDTKSLVNALDPAHVISIYHPNVPPGEVVYDISGPRHGVRFGSLRLIRSISMRESIHYLGGIELLFPLFLNLETFTEAPTAITHISASTGNMNPPKSGSPIASSPENTDAIRTSIPISRPTTPSEDIPIPSKIVEAMANIVYSSNQIKESLLKSKSLSVLALIFERIPIEFVDIHLLQSLGSFIGAMTTASDESLANLGLLELLWNPRIWTRPSFEIQQQHHKFLLAHIQTKAAHFRSQFGVSFLVDLLRSYPCQTIPLTIPMASLALLTHGNIASPTPSRVSLADAQSHTTGSSASLDLSVLHLDDDDDSPRHPTPSSSGLSSPSIPIPAPAMQSLFTSILIEDKQSAAMAKASVARLPTHDPVSRLSSFSIAQIRELRLIILRMMELETEYLLRPDEMSALLALMAAVDENAACEVEDSAKFLLACFDKEPRHNYNVLQGLGGFYVFLPMLDSREESVRLLCTQLLRAVLGVLGDDKERGHVASQMAVVLSLSLSSYPLTLSTYYALMSLILGDSVEVDWRCDWRVKGSSRGDLIARVIGFPDLDGSQSIKHPEFLPLIFELLGRVDRRGSAPAHAEGWDFVIRVLQDFRLLFSHRPPEHQHGAPGKRAKNSNHLPQFRNWAIFQTQPDWFDHLLLLYAQASDTRKLRARTDAKSTPQESPEKNADASKAPSSAATSEDVNVAFDMIWTMMNHLLAFPMLELKDGWKVVQGAEVAVYRFSPRYNNHSSTGILFKPLNFLRHMYSSLLKNLTVELDRLFSSKSPPQRYSFFWENVTHLTLLVEEYLFYQPGPRVALVVRDSTGADSELVNKQNVQQLRMHMHRSATRLLEVLPARVVAAAASQSSSSSESSSETSSSAASVSSNDSATPPPTSSTPSSTASGDSPSSSTGIQIAVTPHPSLTKTMTMPSMSLGRWKDFELALNLFDLLDYVIPHTPFSTKLTNELQSILSPSGKAIAGPTPGDMGIIESWFKVDIGREWGKEKHKILVTILRTLVTTLFDAEVILRPIAKPAPSEPAEAAKQKEEEEKLLAKRESFFAQSILRMHRMMAMLSKGPSKSLPTAAQPLAAGIAFAISSVSNLSNVANTMNYSDPPFVDVVLFCTSKLLKLMTQASEYPSAATSRVIDLVKLVLGRWTDLSYYDGAMQPTCPEANPFIERKHVFYKEAPTEAILAFASDLIRSPRHQLWRGRIVKAVNQVEHGAVLSLKPMIARRDYHATTLDTNLERVRLDRTNDSQIHKHMRSNSQKYVNAFYTALTLYRQRSAREAHAALRNYYRLFHQLHESRTLWHLALLEQPRTEAGLPLYKIDKSEQRPRLRRKLRHNFLGDQHLTATHAYHKEQWAKQQLRKQKQEDDSSASASEANSSEEIPVRRIDEDDPLLTMKSPPLSPSSSFVKNVKVLNLPLSRAGTPTTLSIVNSASSASAPTSPTKFIITSPQGVVLSADEEFEELLNEVDTDEFKNLEPSNSNKSASTSSLPAFNPSAPSIGPMQSGQPISHILGEKVTYSSPCELILPEVKILGRVFVTAKNIHFQYDEANSQVIHDMAAMQQGEPTSPRSLQLSASMIGIKDIGYFNWTRTLFQQKFCDRVWRLKDLTAIYCRRYMLSWTAVELAFENNGKNFFLNLPKEENKRLFHAIEDLRPPKLRSSLFCTAPQYFKKMSETTERWRRREISNFDYLVYLNQAASRTVNDLTQYPVFPWVLTNYTSEHIDLNDPRNFRDLTKPIGALEPARLEKFVERYENFIDDSIPRFHYGSHYSSAGAVLYYLLRLEPYTTQFICLQGGKFDYPDRLFSSVAESWDNCLRSTTDVKELIPEFFYLPDFLENRNQLDLGTKTLARSPIDNVLLPPWANGSAHEFIRVHREALESDYVSANLHHWIDLIFGYKQRGREAVNACNTFFHVTYEGEIDLDALDAEQRQAMLSQIENFGQTPAQLLETPHPAREPSAREKRITLLPQNDLAPGFNKERLPLFQLMSLRSKHFTSRLPFSTPYSIHVVGKSHLLTVNIYGEFLLHKWDYRPPMQALIAAISDSHAPEVHPALELDTQFSSNASPHSFPKDPSQPIMRAQLADAFMQRLLPGNKRFHTHSLGPLYSKRYAHSRFTFEVSPDDPNFAFSAGHWDGSLHTVYLEDFIAPNFPVLSIRQHLPAHRLPITCFAMSEGFLVTGSDDCTAKLWSIAYERKQLKINPTALYTIRSHSVPITAVAVNKALDLIVTASEDGVLAIHQLDQRRNRTRATAKLPGPVSRLIIISSGYILAYCYANCQLVTYSMCGQVVAEMSLAEGEDLSVSSLAGALPALHHTFEDSALAQIIIAKNAPIVIIASGATIDFRSVPSLSLLYIFHSENRDSNICSLRLSDDERVLFVGFHDGALTVISLPDWGSDLEL